MSDSMHAVYANNDALAARAQELQAERDALRADLAALYTLLRGVRYTQTVGEINHIRLTCNRVAARWKLVQS